MKVTHVVLNTSLEPLLEGNDPFYSITTASTDSWLILGRGSDSYFDITRSTDSLRAVIPAIPFVVTHNDTVDLQSRLPMIGIVIAMRLVQEVVDSGETIEELVVVRGDSAEESEVEFEGASSAATTVFLGMAAKVTKR